MKGIRLFGRGTVLPALILSALALIQAPIQTQERAPDPDRRMVERTDRAIDHAVLRLKHFRAVGDLESAGRLFDLLFPPGQEGDVDAAAKTADEPLSNRLEDTAWNVKEMSPEAGGVLVFSSFEHEKAPSLDLLVPGSGEPEIFIAAEQWSEGWPRNIRVRKSADSGLTWAETAVFGDGHSWSQPTLRQISDEAVGICFVKHRNGDDRDVYFTRLSKDLASDAEFSVASGRSQRENPAMASDHPAYSEPYVYLVYAEREGAFHSIRFQVSRDLGASWSRAVTVASFSGPAGSAGEISLAYDLDRGALHLAYTCPQGASTGIAVSSSTSFGARWSGPVFVTPEDDRPASRPKVAAAGGTVLVAYERSAGASGRDVGLAYSTSGGRRWNAGGRLASSAADESGPDLRASKGPGPPRFFLSYVQDGARVFALSCEASDPEIWSAGQVVQDGISVFDGGSVAVLPMTDPQGEASAGVAWSGPNPDHDVYFGASWLQSALLDDDPRLTVDPPGGLISTGSAGGPFSPASKAYTLRNRGDGTLAWTAAKTRTWTTLSPTSGTLKEGASVTVTVSINAEANALAPGTYSDTVSFTNTTNGRGNTTRSVSLTVSAPPGALSVAPGDGLTSSGMVGGPFSPSSLAYTLQNTGGTTIAWTAAKTRTWTTLSSTSGTLSAGATATVTVSINALANALAPGTYNDTVSFTNTTNGVGNTTRPVSLTVTPAGGLSVTPGNGLASSGFVGGPFSPSSLAYTLQNTGGTSIAWTAAKTRTWTTLSSTSGTLSAGATATVTVSINAEANALAAGTYNDTVSFTNTTNGRGNTTRPVSLMVSAPPGTLSVAPGDGLASSGLAGGPFSPSSLAYTLQNTGGTSIAWTATKTRTWTTLSSTSGTLSAGATATVTVSINAEANALAAGTYSDTVSFTNTTNGRGNTTRPVSLTVSDSLVLSVTPDNRDVGAAAGTTTFDVANSGGGTLDWTASVVGGGEWLSIQSGAIGTGGGTITLGFTANQTALLRQGIVRVVAAGASGSPKYVTVTQTRGFVSLGLSGQRLIENAWIIQRQYGKLTVTVDNPSSIVIGAYIIYRRTGGQGYQVLRQIEGSSVPGASWSYDDAFLEPGTSYTYKVVALDVLGTIIGESNEVSI
jgi:spore coat protein U-like protein